jgi:hypothetical protein
MTSIIKYFSSWLSTQNVRTNDNNEYATNGIKTELKLLDDNIRLPQNVDKYMTVDGLIKLLHDNNIDANGIIDNHH